MTEAKLCVKDPDAIEFTMTMTMTLGMWHRIRSKLSCSDGAAATAFVSAVNQMCGKATKEFMPDEPVEEKPHEPT